MKDFSNPPMGLSYVADALDVSHSCLFAALDKSIKEIARPVGFSSDFNFIRVFKK